jgi:hypothetical protein
MADDNSTVRKARKSVAPYPEYSQIVEYLAQSEHLPALTAADLPEGVLGAYVMPGFADSEYKKPVIELDRFYTGSSSPANVAATVLHEFTHASQSAMRKQVKNAGTQFKEAHSKLYSGPDRTRERDMPLAELAKQLDASWADENAGYRSAPFEIQAFGVGNSATKTPSSGRPPPHLDATAATEFMILLDLAMRDLQAQQKK